MARIVYAASGEGLGHATRAHSVSAGLIERGHDLRLVSYHRGSAYLRDVFPDRTVDVFGFRLVCEQGRVLLGPTARSVLQGMATSFVPNLRHIAAFFREFRPDLLVTDAEIFTPLVAWWLRIPYISLDNLHVLTHCSVERPPGHECEYWNTRAVIRTYSFGARRYLISSFIPAPVRYGPTVMLPPVLRQRIYQIAPSRNPYLVAYFGAGGGAEHMQRALESFAELPTRAYGFPITGNRGPVTYKKISAEEFLQDLAGCAGVVATSGHSLISECLYLQKPMLLLPVAGQFEQLLNAFHVRRLGVGDYVSSALTTAELEAFCGRLPEYERALARQPRPSLEPVLDAVEAEL